jgi:putative transcriptional regulator
MIKPGTLLVAHPSVEQEKFKKSVILITKCDSERSSGFILNKPSSLRMQDILDGLYFSNSLNQNIYDGGPVSPRAICMLHTNDWKSNNTVYINKELSLSSDQFMLDQLNDDIVPSHYRFFVGISNWYPGQLEDELAHNIWLTLNLVSLVAIFEYEYDQLWSKCVEWCAQKTMSRYL